MANFYFFSYLCLTFPKMAGIAQLVRALACGARGHGFESHCSPNVGVKIGFRLEAKPGKRNLSGLF